MSNASSVIAETGQGLILVGKFLALGEGRPYDRQNGETVTPGVVSVLVGSSSFKVEFRSVQDALKGLGGAEPEVLSEVAIPVFAQGPWDKAAGRRGRVFYAGRIAS